MGRRSHKSAVASIGAGAPGRSASRWRRFPGGWGRRDRRV